MKVAYCTAYGAPDVVEVRDVPTPAPKDDEVLIRIRATTVSSGDARIRGQSFPKGFATISKLIFGSKKPRKPVLGVELSGVVETTGRKVTRFKVGDEVFAMTGMRMGAHAEYICLPENSAIALKPSPLSFEEAAALSFGGTTALFFLRDQGCIQKGERLLVIGASGTVGSAAIQLAKYFGAHVTAVCSTRNVERVQGLGVVRTIDYTREDFLKNADTYDLVMDTVGLVSFKTAQHLLNERGRLLLVSAGVPEMLDIPLVALTSKKKVVAGAASEKAEDLRFLAELAQKRLYTPLIGEIVPLREIARAHALVDTRHKVGSVVVRIE
jgi:NADPH:quinone reductase-like Zn-dependent oxidoreductase